VDWTESQSLVRTAEEAAFKSRLGSPEITAEGLRWTDLFSDGKDAIYEFRLTNRSNAVLDYVELSMDVFNAEGEFLGSSWTNESNLRPALPYVKEITFYNVKGSKIASWKLTLKRVSVHEEGSQYKDGMAVFTLNETAKPRR
jgi:hypothetical protein